MKITIVGGGNIGTQFAVHCAEKGHEVTVFTSAPELYDGTLSIVNDGGIITHEGKILLATSDPETAFRSAECIMITMPATMMDSVADMIYHHAGKKAIIGVVPGNGGSECAFEKCIRRGNPFFGIERVPAIARLIKKGKIVKSTGYRKELHVAALPAEYAEICAELIQGIFNIRTTVIPNFLNLTMTPSNPILHTSRLRSLFGEWKPGKYYSNIPLFYEDWDDESSELLIAMDEEVQEICRSISEIDLSFVKSLKIHYESPDVHSMTRKISSISAFKGITTPVKQTEDGYMPDLDSRYFTADFNYGLSIIQQIGRMAEVKMPCIDETMNWYKSIYTHKDMFEYKTYGIRTKEDLFNFYSI